MSAKQPFILGMMCSSFLALNANGALITSWENAHSAGGGTYVTTNGVTDGAYSIRYSAAAGFDQKTIYQPVAPNAFLAALAATKKLYVDLTADAITGSPSITNFQFVLQVTTSTTTNYYSGNYAPAVIGTGAVNKQTLLWDLSALSLPTSGSVVTTLQFTVSENKPRTFWLDNLRTSVVPEPSAAAVAGIALLAGHRCRRRGSV